MKLITEVTESLDFLLETAEGAKQYFIQGIFLQANIKNRNGRVYPLDILQREVQRYNTKYIHEDRALGELGHPQGPTINLDRVSHKIISLVQEGQNFVGKALILDTPNGKIVKNLIDAKVKLAVSSRGMGTLKQFGGSSRVQEDFMLATPADIVADPSAPDAFVNGIMEGVEWLWSNGVLEPRYIEGYKKSIDKAAQHGLHSEELDEARINAFQDFFERISKG